MLTYYEAGKYLDRQLIHPFEVERKRIPSMKKQEGLSIMQTASSDKGNKTWRGRKESVQMAQRSSRGKEAQAMEMGIQEGRPSMGTKRPPHMKGNARLYSRLQLAISQKVPFLRRLTTVSPFLL